MGIGRHQPYCSCSALASQAAERSCSFGLSRNPRGEETRSQRERRARRENNSTINTEENLRKSWCFDVIICISTGKQKICGKKIDLAIVLDASASIGEENFKLGKDFAKRLIKRFTISKDKVQVSLIAYSQYINIASRFSDNNEKSLDNTLDNIVYEASSSGTGKTLEAVNFEVFTEKSGARSGRPGKKTIFPSSKNSHFQNEKCKIFVV